MTLSEFRGLKRKEEETPDVEPNEGSLTLDEFRKIIPKIKPDEKLPAAQGKRPSWVFFTFQGTSKGIAKTIALPFEAVNHAASHLGIPDLLEKIGIKTGRGGELFEAAERQFEKVKPVTAGERIAERVGEEIGFGALPTFGFLKMSQKTFEASKGIIGAFKKVLSDIAKQDPAKFVALETGVAASSGAGGGISREAFPDSATADLAASLTAGLAPSILLKIFQFVRQLPSKLLPPVLDKDVAQKVGKDLSETIKTEIGGEFDKGAEEAAGLSREIKGFEPTTAQATGDAGALAKERALIREEPRTTTKFIEQQNRSQKAIRDKLNELVDEGEIAELDVKDILETRKKRAEVSIKQRQSRAEEKVMQAGEKIEKTKAGAEEAKVSLDKRIEELDKSLDKRIKTAKSKADASIENLKGTATNEDAGRIIAQTRANAEKQFSEASDEIFRRIDPENKIELPFTDVEDMAKSIVAEQADAPEIIKRTAKTSAKKFDPILLTIKDTVPFNKVKDIRSRVLTEIRDESSSLKPDKNKLRLLKKFRTTLDNALDQLMTDPKLKEQFPEAGERFRKFNKFFKAGSERLREGVVSEVAREKKVGLSEIAGKFFTKGKKSKEAIDDFNRAFKGKKEANEALEVFAGNKLAEQAVDSSTGKISTKKLTNFLRDFKEPLESFPQLKNKINSAAKAQKHLEFVEQKARDIAKKVRKGEISTREAEVLGFSEKALFDAEKTFDMAQDRFKEVTTGSISRGLSKTLNEADKSVAGRLLNADAGRAMRDALNSKTPSRDVAKLLKLMRNDPRGKRGLRILFHEELLRKGATKNIAPDGIPFLSHNYVKDFLTVNKGALKQLYTPKEISILKKIQRALELNNRSVKSPLPAGSDTFQNLKLSQNVNAITARIFAVQRKVVSKSFIIAERIARFWAKGRELESKEALRALMEDAIFNPEVAETLIMLSKNVDEKIITKRIRSHLASIGFRDKKEEK